MLSQQQHQQAGAAQQAFTEGNADKPMASSSSLGKPSTQVHSMPSVSITLSMMWILGTGLFDSMGAIHDRFPQYSHCVVVIAIAVISIFTTIIIINRWMPNTTMWFQQINVFLDRAKLHKQKTFLSYHFTLVIQLRTITTCNSSNLHR